MSCFLYRAPFSVLYLGSLFTFLYHFGDILSLCGFMQHPEGLEICASFAIMPIDSEQLSDFKLFCLSWLLMFNLQVAWHTVVFLHPITHAIESGSHRTTFSTPPLTKHPILKNRYMDNCRAVIGYLIVGSVCSLF